MKILKHIFPVVVAVMLFSSCSGGEGKVISRGDLAEIYAEMLMADQWIAKHPELRRTADTSLVYEPILNKYGYTTEDYVRSVDVYMDDPERYSRILRETGVILNDKLEELEVKRQQQVEEEKHRKYMESLMAAVEVDIKYIYDLSDTMKVHIFQQTDSVSVEMDSLGFYRLYFIDRSDSLIDGPRVVPKDTVAVKDTLKAL